MDRFENVGVTKTANIYFDGKVTSRSVEFADGSVKTLGIMLPGNYEFGTGKAELMEIQSGLLQWSIVGRNEWQSVAAGGAFNIPADSRFEVRVEEITDYICSFLEES
jgi:uncharacterized protein YaiE (UPF0345 family)